MRYLALLGVLLAAREVRADCGIPQWIGTASGTSVPSTGSLYVYDESLRWDGGAHPMFDVAWTGTEAGAATFTRVDDTVARLDYAGPPGSTLTLTPRYWGEPLAYHLVEHWQPPAHVPRVVQFWHHHDQWTCSWADSLMIQIDQRTAAVRARWTHRGRRVEWIVPARTERTKAVVELGKVDCGSTTLPPEQLLEGGTLELVAIRFDGSEAPITGFPKRISTAGLRDDSRWWEEAAFMLVSLDARPPVYAPAPTEVGHRYALVALLLLASGLAIGWRLRVRAPTDLP